MVFTKDSAEAPLTLFYMSHDEGRAYKTATGLDYVYDYKDMPRGLTGVILGNVRCSYIFSPGVGLTVVQKDLPCEINMFT